MKSSKYCILFAVLLINCDATKYHYQEFFSSESQKFLGSSQVLEQLNHRADGNITCTSNSDCHHTAICWTFVGETTGQCHCRFGTSGDWCQVIDECDQRPWSCGSGTKCAFDVEQEIAVCVCEEPGQMYDAVSRTCRDCFCGDHGVNCHFFGDEKVCTCEPGFTQGPNGLCRLQCNTEMPCRNGGICIAEKCSCKTGTEGTFCEDIIMCKEGGCKGQSTCAYDSDVGPYCKCPDSGQMYNEREKDCVDCRCGQHSINCDFDSSNKYEKTCQCKKGFSSLRGVCEPCDCGAHSTECEFDANGERICTCTKGYSFVDGLCKECQCGMKGTCEFKDGVKTCTCEEGYQDNGGLCERCDCEENSEGCAFDSLGALKCSCKKGFIPAEGICIDIDECLDPTICPPFSSCNNTDGGYNCQCKSGYLPLDGMDPKSGCVDIDECKTATQISNDSLVGCAGKSFTKCINTPGSFLCVCEDESSPFLDENKLAKDPSLNGCQAPYWDPWKLAGGLFIIFIFGIVIGSCVYFFHEKSPGRQVLIDLLDLHTLR